MMEQRLRPHLEKLGIRCFGAVPECEEAELESRHRGLTLPMEQKRLQDKLERLADRLEQCLDLDGILELAESACQLETDRNGEGEGADGSEKGSWAAVKNEKTAEDRSGMPPAYAGRQRRRMGVAVDEAFCFYYQENLDFLKEHGWELLFFSPIHDLSLIHI